MTQERYANKILSRFGIQDCKLHETPCESKLEYTDGAKKLEKPRVYRKAVGRLMYLETCTGPDLSFVVSKLSQHCSEPSEEHWNTVKHMYLKGTTNHGPCFKKDDTDVLGLIVHNDADWAADVTDRHNTIGYCASLSQKSSLISWKNRK